MTAVGDSDGDARLPQVTNPHQRAFATATPQEYLKHLLTSGLPQQMHPTKYNNDGFPEQRVSQVRMNAANAQPRQYHTTTPKFLAPRVSSAPLRDGGKPSEHEELVFFSSTQLSLG